MDKETLSNYGWIVILVLILSVLLALASPFGLFVADGFKAAYTGLFDVENKAMDVVMNATGGPIKDPALNPSKTIPEGGKYIEADGTEHKPGDPFPEEPQTGDRYEYGDYIYAYNQYPYNSEWKTDESFNGWGADVKTSSYRKETLGALLESINNKPLTSLKFTFYCCINLKTAPKIPQDIKNLDYAFWGCKSLERAPIIPNGVTKMTQSFYGCYELKEAPIIPNTVTSLEYTFGECYALNTYAGSTQADGDFSGYQLPNSITSMLQTFYMCRSMVTAPAIPSSVLGIQTTFAYCTSLVNAPDLSNAVNIKDMQLTFKGCTSLTNAPVIPETVTHAMYAFADCTSLTTAPAIPSKTWEIRGMFKNCTALTGEIEFITSTGTYEDCFSGVDFTAQNITLAGASTSLDKIGATGKHYCALCNGTCDNIDAHTSSISHIGGSATCSQKAVCSDCGKEYGEHNNVHNAVDGKCIDCGITVTVIETTHNPYSNNQNDVIIGTWDYSDAQSVTIEVTYQTENTSYDWICFKSGEQYINYNGQLVSSAYKFGGSTITTRTITTTALTGSVIFRTDSGGNDYYGAYIAVTPNY